VLEITEDKLNILKENYLFAQDIKKLQEPLSKYEITYLRKLIKKHIDEGYTNYLRLVSIYSIDRDILLNIYVRHLFNLLIQEEENND
jgi:hypothetical protein